MRAIRYLLFLVLLVVCTASVSASFDVFLTPVSNKILPTEYAEYELTIHNPSLAEESVQIFTTDQSWIIISPLTVKIPPESSVTETLVVKPKSTAFIGPHGVTLQFRSTRTDAKKQMTEVISVMPYDSRWGYVPNVALGVNINSEVDPRSKMGVDVLLRNRNNQNVTNLTVRIYSDIFSEEYITSIGALQEKTNTVVFELNPLENPGARSLHVWVIANGKTISESTKPFEIIGYSDVSVSAQQKSAFFRTEENIVFKNSGNTATIKQHKRSTNLFIRLFQNAEPKPAVVREQGHEYLVWDLKLGSQQQESISIVENYRLLFFLCLALVVSVILYFVLRSPILAKKFAEVTHQSDEGGSVIKVFIHVRNRSGKRVGPVRVSDRITPISGLIDEKHLGTLKPSKVITHSKRGTLLKWELEHIEPYEERIISYRMKTRFGIVGGMYFRPAVVRFDVPKHGERMIKSNSFNLKI